MLQCPTKEVRDRQACRLAEDVPASHVDRRLRVWMAHQRVVHALIDNLNLPRVQATKRRGHRSDRRSSAFAVCSDVVRAERALFSPSDETLIGGGVDTRD